ncbi:MAG: response regulator [Deltaproteobacteria bacterium]|nr:response regulator [Deltaproteobacteria bacterium]
MTTPSTPSPRRHQQGRILVVDDSKSQRAVETELLERNGYEVEEAETGSQCLAKVASFRPDLILEDVMLPDVDGFRLCRIIKSNPKFSEIPVIFITSLDKPDDVLKGFQAGGADYVAKPFHNEEFLARVQAHLDLAVLTRERIEQAELMTQTQSRIQRTVLAEGLAHNLNNLLAPLVGNLSWLRNEISEAKHREAIDDMLQIVERLKRVAQALTGNMERTMRPDATLGSLMAAVCNDIELTLKPDVRIEQRFDEEDRTNVPSPLGPTLTAILVNAVEAVETKGRITVEAAHDETGPTGETVVITVTDTGHGLDEETAQKAFLPFFSTKDTVGAGLGLHQAQVALERVGGTVRLEGSPGQGAVCTIELPIKRNT